MPRLQGGCKRGIRRAMASRTVPTIFSAQRRRAATARAQAMAGRNDAARYLFDEISDDVFDRLDFMRFEPATALVVGDPSGVLADGLIARGTEVTQHSPLTLEEEQPYAMGPFDFIASVTTLGSLNDLPGALVHIRAALARGGLAMISFPGAGSLPLLRSVMLAADEERPAARIHPQVDTRAAAELMQRAGFARQVVDSRSLEVGYRSLNRLVEDLRAQGLSNVLADPGPALTRRGLALAQAAFRDAADEEGRAVERFEILTLTGWKD